MKLQTRVAAISGGVLILAALAFIALRGNGTTVAPVSSVAESIAPMKSGEGVVRAPTPKPVEVSTVNTLVGATGPAPAAVDGASSDEKGSLSASARARLLDLATLGQKAFMNDEEKARRLDAMKDSKFLREIALVLRSQDVDQITRRQQYQAIDALVASAVLGTREAALQLRGVVADKQVEDPSLPQPVRENLAGIKAEVLYNWTSRAPSAASDIAASLPGPVSEKIWQNVKDTQSRNANEPVSVKR